MIVSRGTLFIEGVPACSRCQRRPRRPYPGSRRRYHSYCGPCHADYMAERRAGKTEILVTEDELALLRQIRAAS